MAAGNGMAMEGIGGWLLVYVVGSVPMALFYAAGLAGRFFNYHLGILAGIFLVLTAPLVLVVSKLASAPAWNIASLWVGAGSTSLVVLAGALFADEARLRDVAPTVAAIAFLSIVWALVWTMYFLTSERVTRTFG